MRVDAASLAPEAISDDRSPVLRHALDEYRRFAGRRGRDNGIAVRVAVEPTAPVNTFRAVVDAQSVTISGREPRSILDGVYWLLEGVGYSWVGPGPAGDGFDPEAALVEGVYEPVPGFPARTLVLGQDALHDDWRDWVEWASRNRLNGIFLHDTPPSRLARAGPRPSSAEELTAAGGGWLFERWDADGAAIRAEADRRGMTVQFAGHHLPALLPRELFAAYPDWFPMRGGVRDGRYNLCVSAAGARAHLHAAAVEFFRRFPGADVYHAWADDIRGGGWCQCERCAALSPSDQALRATNIVAGALASVAPAARVAHLAYRDTTAPPTATEPADNVVLLWAPRERCYAHGIADASCERNARYFRQFDALAALFGRDPERIAVFEYYSDAILFKGLAPTHLEVLPADATAYRASGAGDFQDLMVGDRPWVGPPWHAWWFARCAWAPGVEATAEVDRFSTRAFGPGGPALSRYYRALEPAYREFLDRHDFEDVPGRDVLDLADRPRHTLLAVARRLPFVARAFRDASREAEHVPGSRAAAEEAQARFVNEMTLHLAERAAAWAAAIEGHQDEALAAARRAGDALEAINEWDREWSSPGFAVIRNGMRRSMERHTAEVARLAGGH